MMATKEADVAPRSARSEQLTIPLVGMTCAACATRIQKKVSKGEGVEDVVVNFGTERATVTYDAAAS